LEIHIDIEISSGWELRIFLPAAEGFLIKNGVERPTIGRRIVEVVVGMDAADNPSGVTFADGMRCHAESDHIRELHFPQ
jgi:hypothetical protein